MVHLLQRHAFAIEALLAASLVLAYALPAEVLKPLLAPGLKLDTYGEFGFLAIALVETRSLRPAFLPEALGLNFFLAGYRIFTRYQTPSGRTLRGLRILRSDTDRRSMEFFGNLLTHYGYERSLCKVSRSDATYGVVEGVRQEWKPKPVKVTVHRNTFLEQERFRAEGAVLANAFYLENVPYAWRPGVRDVLP